MNRLRPRFALLAAARAPALLCAGFVASTAACESDTTSSTPGDAGDATAPDAAHVDSASDASDANGAAAGDATDGGLGAPSDAGAQAEATAVAKDATTDAAPDAPSDAGSDAPATPDASLSDAPQDVTRPLAVAAVRVANFAPDAPALDFCLAPHGTGAFQGPMLANLIDAGAVGLALTQDCATPLGAMSAAACPVSSYFLVTPGAYDLRFVTPRGDCSGGPLPDITTLTPLGAGSAATLALLGKLYPVGSEPALRVVQLTDDSIVTPSTFLRFVHAAPGLAQTSLNFSIDFNPGMSPGPQTLFAAVPFGQSDTQVVADGGWAMADPNGYVPLAPYAQAGFSVQLHATSDAGAPASPQASSNAESAAAGSILTVVLANGTAGPQLWECVDNAGTVGAYASCFAISR